MKISKYNKKQQQEVNDLVRESFGIEEGDHVVALIQEIREGKYYLPEYDLVATEGNEVIGHCMISILPFEDCQEEMLLLSPVAVKKSWQNKSMGTKMVREALKKVKNKKYLGIIVEGDPHYYHRFGFTTSVEFGIFANEAIQMPSEECLMAMELVDGGLDGFFGEVDFSIYTTL